MSFADNMYRWLQREGYGPRFEHPGIYRITIDGVIVYIGKSKNMLYRLAEHFVGMKIPKEHKYRILAEAKRRGHRVNFDVLSVASSTLPSEIEEEIGKAEGEFIRQYRPPLNTQIPKESDWRKYDYNAAAATITLDEILNGRGYKSP